MKIYNNALEEVISQWNNYSIPNRLVTMDEAILQAQSSDTAIRFRQEMEHLVADSLGINIILNCAKKTSLDEMLITTNVLSESYLGKIHGSFQTSCKCNEKGFKHRHNFCELVYVIQGEAINFIHDKSLLLKQGDFLLMNANTAHEELIQSNSQILFIQLNEETLQKILPDCKLSPELKAFFNSSVYAGKDCIQYLHFAWQASGYMEECILSLLKEWKQTCGSKYIYLGLICKILTQLGIGSSYKLQVYSESLSENFILFKNLENYLEKVLWNVTGSELSEVFFYSSSYLSQLLKRYTNMTLSKYCLEHKLEYAAKLLRETDNSVNKIIELSHYQNKTFFHNKFNEKYNITMEQYRKMFRELH